MFTSIYGQNSIQLAIWHAICKTMSTFTPSWYNSLHLIPSTITMTWICCTRNINGLIFWYCYEKTTFQLTELTSYCLYVAIDSRRLEIYCMSWMMCYCCKCWLRCNRIWALCVDLDCWRCKWIGGRCRCNVCLIVCFILHYKFVIIFEIFGWTVIFFFSFRIFFFFFCLYGAQKMNSIRWQQRFDNWTKL